MDPLLYDYDEAAILLRDFAPADWIGVGRSFEESHWLAQAAFTQHMRVPSGISHLVPTQNMAPRAAAAAFIAGHWAHANDRFDNIASHAFLDEPPNLDLEVHDILDFQVPSEPVIQSLQNRAGQAWMDGCQSVRFWHDGRNDWLLCPFWMITAMHDVHQMRRARWAEGWTWITQVERTATTAGWKLCQLAKSYMASLPGCVGHAGGDDLTYEKLARLLGHHDLHGAIIDNLLRITAASLPENRRAQIIFADTLFSQSLTAGAHRYISSPGDKILRRYATLLQEMPRPSILLFPINIENLHWTAGKIDIQARVIHYGDSLLPHGSGRAPSPLRQNLVEWLQGVLPGTEFVWQTDLRCPTQRDGWNCALITANVLAHEGIGTPLWNMAIGDELRLYAFCKLCESLLVSEPEHLDDPFALSLESPSYSLPGPMPPLLEPLASGHRRELEDPRNALALLGPQEPDENSVLSSSTISDSGYVRRRTYNHPRIEFAIDEPGGLLLPVTQPL